MPFSDFRLMALALLVVAGCALATTLRSFGFTRWFPPKVRRLVQKCRANLKRKPKERVVHYDNSWTVGYGYADLDPSPPKEGEPPRPIGKRKRRPKK
jgi:hypothetical protein